MALNKMSLRNESKAEKDRHKQIEEKCQNLLAQMLRDDDNKYCVDCDAKGPRWASWTIGVFLCIRCAGIHRNLGTHISRVKSVNLDSWTPEQVVSLQQMGNSRARAVYEATLPDTWRRPQTDSSLETFIRAKYQHKRYIAKEWVQPAIPKVNWDKELDEEAERLRKQKKERQGSVALPPIKQTPAASAVRVPALPKPTSSPKSNRSATISSEEVKPTSASIDLLGLSNTSSNAIPTSNGSSDDVFSSFLSAPPSQPQAATEANVSATDLNDGRGRSAEEDSFFNQPAPNSEAKKPLSKDSILALYASQSAPQPQTTLFPAQGFFPANPGMGFPATNPSNFQTAPNFSTPNMAPFNAPSAFGGPIRPQTNQPAPAPGSNPFFGLSFGSIPHQQGFPAQHGSVDSKPSDDLLADFTSGQNSGTLQHQLAGLNISQPGVGAAAPNFAAMSGFSYPSMPQNFANPAPQPSMGQTFTNQLWQ